MEEALRALLLADGAVAALAGGRVDWGETRQSAGRPYAVLTLIGGAPGRTQSGPDGLFQGRVQIDCAAETYAEAKALSRAVRGALDGRSAGGFQGIFLSAERDGRDAEVADALFGVSLDFLIAWSKQDG
ncbi:DUF3168 domain-containing protein [Pikeienuella sp. HZG-20]|uniref:DUF3168 domain-containing protein n=1 Tax=Paludibacillus litoralis TaxID=3133267 RepID=UPI0030EDB53A